MKVTKLDPRESLWRKIDWYQRKLRKNYAEIAFRGALRLENAGIDTGKPVAFWSYGTSWWNEESYFLYEHVDAGRIGRYNKSALSVTWRFEQLIFRCMVEKTIAMVRRLHAHGLRHGDIHSGNALVDFDPEGCTLNEHAISSRLRVYLIDTDHVSKAGVTLPGIKPFFDLRCLHCIDFHAYGRRCFLKNYLGGDYRVWWWWVLNFWSRGGVRLKDWFKPRRGAPRLAPVFIMLGVLASNV